LWGVPHSVFLAGLFRRQTSQINQLLRSRRKLRSDTENNMNNWLVANQTEIPKYKNFTSDADARHYAYCFLLDDYFKPSKGHWEDADWNNYEQSPNAKKDPGEDLTCELPISPIKLIRSSINRIIRNQLYRRSVRIINRDTGEVFALREQSVVEIAREKKRRFDWLSHAIELLIADRDNASVFYTITVDSHLHRNKNGDKWTSPAKVKQAMDIFNNHWQAIRKAFNEQLFYPFYFIRATEPHKDGTPHQHYLIHVHDYDQAKADRIIRRIHDRAIRRRTGLGVQRDIKWLDDGDGKNINAYIGKYISKNFGSDTENMDEVARWHLSNGWYSEHNIRRFSGSQIPIPFEYKDRIYQYLKNVENRKELTVKDIYDWALDNVKIIHHNQKLNKTPNEINRSTRILNNPKNPKLIIIKKNSDVLFDPDKSELIYKVILEKQKATRKPVVIYDNRRFEMQIDNIVDNGKMSFDEPLNYKQRVRLLFEAERLDYINNNCRIENQHDVVKDWEKYLDSHKPPI
jgi:hypothetical protein